MVGLRPASSISGSRPRGGRGSAGVPASSWSQLSSSANPLRARAVPGDRRELRVNFRRKFQTRIPRKFRLYWTDVDRFRLLTRGLSDTTQSRGFAANLGRGAAFAAIWGRGRAASRQTGGRAAERPPYRSGRSETATVALDSSRDNLAALLARHGVVTGG